MRIEGLYASFSPSFEPLTDCPLTDTQRYCDILLLPPLLFELPCSFASFFSPIGFLWCSHTSYFTTSLLPLAEISSSKGFRKRSYNVIASSCSNVSIEPGR